MATTLIYLEFLHQQTNFRRNALTTNQLICNNEGLLTRIKEVVQWTYTTPNMTQCTEWDIKSVILDTNKALAIHFSFIHLKSHQDDDIAGHNLSLDTRLNVEADSLGTEYLQQHEPL